MKNLSTKHIQPFDREKGIDISKRIVKGYFSAFNSKDADKDVILQGAFAKSILEHGVDSASNRKIKHLANHMVFDIVGNLTELKEDGYGLYFESAIGTHAKGEDAWRMYNEGLITEHSIGFNYISEKMKFEQESDTYYISEVKLWEGSYVTWGANENTPNLTGKGIDEESYLMQMFDLLQVYTKALNSDKYKEQSSIEEIGFTLQMLTNQIGKALEARKHADVKPKFDWNYAINNFKL